MRAALTVRLFCLTVLIGGLTGCKDGLVEPERFGTIEGRVLDFESFAPISGALVSTSPATNAVLTGDDGAFRIEDALIGTYTITARRSGYSPNTTTISVREGQTGRADVLLEVQDEDDEPTPAEFAAEVLNFTNEPFATDSSYVSVEFRALNNGETDISSYEIYFRIDTDRGPFYQEIQGEDLGAGQRDFGTFRKYLLGATATAVVIEDTSVPPESLVTIVRGLR